MEIVFSVNAFSASVTKGGRKGLRRRCRMSSWVGDLGSSPRFGISSGVSWGLGKGVFFLSFILSPILGHLTLSAMIEDLLLGTEAKNDTNF